MDLLSSQAVSKVEPGSEDRSRDPALVRTHEPIGQPSCAKELGVQVVALLTDRPHARTWRVRGAGGESMALVVVSEGASAAARDAFADVAGKLHALGSAGIGVLRVRSVGSLGDAFVTDLWTAGSARRLTALRWPLRCRLRFLRRVFQTLETLHGAGLVHGCLMPDNVLLDDDLHPVLAEAGVVSVLALGDSSAYAPFAAPEVRAGKAPDVRSDVFSAGRLLEDALTGDELGQVEAVVSRCLGPRESRYASAHELDRALADVVAQFVDEPSGRRAKTTTPLVQPTPSPAATDAPSRPRPEEGPLPATVTRARRLPAMSAPLVGIAGAASLVLAIGAAFSFGGSASALRSLLAVALPLSVAASTLLVPWPPRVPIVAHVGFALSCALLVGLLDPLAYAYRAVALRGMRGNEFDRRAAVDEVVRQGRDFRGMSLAGIDLSHLELTGADLRGVDLSHADLSRTRLWGAEIGGTSFDGARLEGADLDHTALARALHLDSATCDEATRLPPEWRCVGHHVSR